MNTPAENPTVPMWNPSRSMASQAVLKSLRIFLKADRQIPPVFVRRNLHPRTFLIRLRHSDSMLVFSVTKSTLILMVLLSTSYVLATTSGKMTRLDS